MGIDNSRSPSGISLDPLLFLIHINDTVKDFKCNICMFADKTTLYVEFEDTVKAIDSLNCDLTSVCKIARQWLVKFSTVKTSSMKCTHKDRAVKPTLHFDSAK